MFTLPSRTFVVPATSRSGRCAQVFGPIAFVSSLLGVTVIGYLVRRSGRASIIILLMVRWPPGLFTSELHGALYRASGGALPPTITVTISRTVRRALLSSTLA